MHRDVKPDNLLVNAEGTVKILDLGLARFFGDETDQITQQTEVKAILGTVDYLAPEQISHGSEVDGRADVYSLGATFYYLLTGQTPFQGGSVAEKLIWRLADEPKPLEEMLPEAPPGLGAILHQMLARDPAQRYQTPGEVVDALAAWGKRQALPDATVAGEDTHPDRVLPEPAKVSRSRRPAGKRGDAVAERRLSRRGLRAAMVFGLLLFAAGGCRGLAALYLALTGGGTVSTADLPVNGDGQTPLSPAKAARRVGETIWLEMTVASVGASQSGSTVFLNSEANYQGPGNFTIVVHKNTAAKLPGVGAQARATPCAAKSFACAEPWSCSTTGRRSSSTIPSKSRSLVRP